MPRLNKAPTIPRKSPADEEASTLSPFRALLQTNIFSFGNYFKRKATDDLVEEQISNNHAKKQRKASTSSTSDSITPESPISTLGSSLFPTQFHESSLNYETSLQGIVTIAKYFLEDAKDTSQWSKPTANSRSSTPISRRSSSVPTSPKSDLNRSSLPHHRYQARKQQAKLEVKKLLDSIAIDPLGKVTGYLSDYTDGQYQNEPAYNYEPFSVEEEFPHKRTSKDAKSEPVIDADTIQLCLKKKKVDLSIKETFPTNRSEQLFHEALKLAVCDIETRIKARELEEALRMASKRPPKKPSLNGIMEGKNQENHFDADDEEALPLSRLTFRKSSRKLRIIEEDEEPIKDELTTQESPNMTINERLRPRDKSYGSISGTMSVGTASTIQSIDLMLPVDDEALNPPKQKIERRIKWIIFGDVRMSTWYHSPFPAEYVCQGDTLWICPKCLKYVADPQTSERHSIKCPYGHPPGEEIYREKELSMFEIDGSKHKLYCQNLCLIAKLFLDHKILYYDVNAFLFYVLTEYDSQHGYRIVGYFSKERNTDVPNNLSCIVVFPGFQSKGYGFFLIDFSYLLTRQEKKVGGPETPLSDLGFLAYAKYWSEVIVDAFHRVRLYDVPSFQGLARQTGVLLNHILATLEWMEVLMRKKDGQLAVNLEKILKFDNLLPSRRRPNEAFLQWKPPVYK